MTLECLHIQMDCCLGEVDQLVANNLLSMHTDLQHHE